LSRRGYSVGDGRFVERAPAEPGSGKRLAAVLLGEYGSAAEEEEILPAVSAPVAVPGCVLLIGGQNAVRRTTGSVRRGRI